MKKSWIFIFCLLASNLSFADSPALFERCQSIFLGGKLLQNLIDEEEAVKEENASDGEYLKKLKALKRASSCLSLLEHAQLKTSGILLDRTPLASLILKSFVKFHQNWLMPTDYDKAPQCQDPFHDDVFDPKTPAYHLTRALFQRDRKVSMAITAFGDLRSIRQGENPKKSERSSISGEEYQSMLGLKEPLDLVGDSQLVGFLYKGQVQFEKVAPINWSQTNSSWDKSRERKKFKLYNHLGGGLIGSPSYLIHYAPIQAFNTKLYQTDGRTNLPRKLALGIFNGILCKEPNESVTSVKIDAANKWIHPITSEQKCLGCHTPLDHFASGLRHLTYLNSASNSKCSKDNPQVLIPANFETSYSKEVWQAPQDPNGKKESFSFSYPVGYYEEERFVGFNQLGRLLAQRPEFYQCQVQKYYRYLFEKDIQSELKVELATKYQEHQDGLKLIQDLISNAPKDLKK